MTTFQVLEILRSGKRTVVASFSTEAEAMAEASRLRDLWDCQYIVCVYGA